MRNSEKSKVKKNSVILCTDEKILFADEEGNVREVNKPEEIHTFQAWKKLGYQFFVNLPAKVGAETATKIKSQDPKTVAWWWQ